MNSQLMTSYLLSSLSSLSALLSLSLLSSLLLFRNYSLAIVPIEKNAFPLYVPVFIASGVSIVFDVYMAFNIFVASH